jgi:ornithine cyclodeaminase/alanine dehydrogenase-like protein (mu-crystallin family)
MPSAATARARPNCIAIFCCAPTPFVEFPPQTRIEGEIQQMDANYPVTEFWRVVTGKAAGRRDASQITLFDSVGFAIEDFSRASLRPRQAEGYRVLPGPRHYRRSGRAA